MRKRPISDIVNGLRPLFWLLFFILAFGAATARAVNPGEASYTAEGVTAYRAIAALDPDKKIRNPDHMAARLVSPQYWRMSIFSLDYAADKKIIEKYRIGIYYYVNARTHHIDGTLKGLAVGNVKQVVNLGAGYDSRAYRLGKQMPAVTFYELDLPATIAEKKRRVRALIGALPGNVVYVPIDFNTQTLKDALIGAGYKPDLKTFFIWEGVTYYISEAAVDATLRFVATARPGSGIIFDYMYREVAEGDYRRYPKAHKPAKRLARMGEPFIFGIEEGDAARFVRLRGLVLRSDLGYRDLGRAYLIRSDGKLDGHPAAYFRIVYAEVPFTPIDMAKFQEKKMTAAVRAVSTAPAPSPDRSAVQGKKQPFESRRTGRGSNAQEAVLEVVDRFVHRWDARDTEGVLALIHEDGKMMYGGYEKLMAAKKDYAAVFAERRPVVGPLRLSDPEVRIDGDLAVIGYRLKVDSFDLEASFTLEKEKAGWMITRFEYD